jgi:hypothetical protein
VLAVIVLSSVLAAAAAAAAAARASSAVIYLRFCLRAAAPCVLCEFQSVEHVEYQPNSLNGYSSAPSLLNSV